MLAILTSTMVVRVANEEKAGDMALSMTKAVDLEFEKNEIRPEQMANLGTLVQIIPEGTVT